MSRGLPTLHDIAAAAHIGLYVLVLILVVVIASLAVNELASTKARRRRSR